MNLSPLQETDEAHEHISRTCLCRVEVRHEGRQKAEVLREVHVRRDHCPAIGRGHAHEKKEKKRDGANVVVCFRYLPQQMHTNATESARSPNTRCIYCTQLYDRSACLVPDERLCDEESHKIRMTSDRQSGKGEGKLCIRYFILCG